MSTPTEAHFDLALQIADAFARSGNVAAARLIADSEARAVAAKVSSLTCTHHNDQQRTECPVCLVVALTTERDQLRVDLELADVMYQRECEVEHELRTEVERLRSDRDCEKRLRKDADEFRENAIERAMKAEADLVALEQSFDDNCRGVVRIADELTAATAEVARLKRDYEYDHKCLHEVRERCESWKQRAERAEAELAMKEDAK